MSRPPTLDAPPSFFGASQAQLEAVVNGCGPACWKCEVVPDSISGVSVVAACNIHDWMYFEGENEQDREAADRLFLRNLRAIVRDAGGWLMPWRLFVVWWAYRAVSRLGVHFFEARSGVKSKDREKLYTG